MSADNVYLKLSNVTKAYKGQSVLCGIDLNVEPGSIIEIQGNNGCGKTTLLSIMLGFEKPNSGIVEGLTLGQGISGYINRPILFNDLTIIENFYYFFMLAQKDIDIEDLLDRLHYLNIKNENKKTKHISTGMQKKVSILRSILTKSSLYIFDEPFSGLDTESIQKIKQLFIKDVQEHNSSIIYTNHNHDNHQSDMTSIYFLTNGRLRRK